MVVVVEVVVVVIVVVVVVVAITQGSCAISEKPGWTDKPDIN